MPRSMIRTRSAAAALVLAMHALFLLLLRIEGRERPEAIAVISPVAGITIRLFPVERRIPGRPDNPASPGSRSAAAPATAILVPAIPPASVVQAPGPQVATEPQPTIDWAGRASAMAARVGQEAESPPQFGPPLQAMRRPCTPRTQYDKATRDLMEPLLPEVHDPVPPGGIGAAPSSVKMGGVRVGIVRLGGKKKQEEQDSSGRKSSFRWKWESPKMGNGGAEQLLTSGWAEEVPYDAMFDDMQAGRTPPSSVPHHDICD